MSYYFVVMGSKDNPLFEATFGTSKHGGDGNAHFASDDARTMNQFIAHAALDLVDEAVWSSGAMYLRQIDRFGPALLHCFVTGTGMRMLLLWNPEATAANAARGVGRGAAFGGYNAGAAQKDGVPGPSEDAMRSFFVDVFENWVKTAMNPFYKVDGEIKSPVFRQRVLGSARKWL